MRNHFRKFLGKNFLNFSCVQPSSFIKASSLITCGSIISYNLIDNNNCLADNSLFSSSKVFSWGFNRYGQLGVGSEENESLPKNIEGLSNIKYISCGSEQSGNFFFHVLYNFFQHNI